jgi:hypothetical protein
MANDPAISQPRRPLPGLRRIVILDNDRFRAADFILARRIPAPDTSSRLLFYPRMFYFATIRTPAVTFFEGILRGDGR